MDKLFGGVSKLRAGWATLLRGVELVVPTKEAGRGRLLRAVFEAVGVPAGLLSKGIPLLAPPPPTPLLAPPPPLLFRLRDWRLMEVGMEAEPLIVGLT